MKSIESPSPITPAEADVLISGGRTESGGTWSEVHLGSLGPGYKYGCAVVPGKNALSEAVRDVRPWR